MHKIWQDQAAPQLGPWSEIWNRYPGKDFLEMSIYHCLMSRLYDTQVTMWQGTLTFKETLNFTTECTKAAFLLIPRMNGQNATKYKPLFSATDKH